MSTSTTRPTTQQLAGLLAQAQGLYTAQPTDYLEGVIGIVLSALELDPRGEWRDEQAQTCHAAGKSGPQRARDFLAGRHAAIRWANGATAIPPDGLTDGGAKAATGYTAGQSNSRDRA